MFAKKGLMAAALGLATIAGVSSASHAQIFGDNFDYHNPTRHSILDFSNDGPYGSNSPKRPGSYSHADDPQPAPPTPPPQMNFVINNQGRAFANGTYLGQGRRVHNHNTGRSAWRFDIPSGWTLIRYDGANNTDMHMFNR